MADVRTTIAIQSDVYLAMKNQYRALGFTRMADLVNVAVREYLKKGQIEENNRRMEVAAADPHYRALLGQISKECAALDAEGLGPDY